MPKGRRLSHLYRFPGLLLLLKKPFHFSSFVISFSSGPFPCCRATLEFLILDSWIPHHHETVGKPVGRPVRIGRVNLKHVARFQLSNGMRLQILRGRIPVVAVDQDPHTKRLEESARLWVNRLVLLKTPYFDVGVVDRHHLQTFPRHLVDVNVEFGAVPMMLAAAGRFRLTLGRFVSVGSSSW
jgi:hypothetical protein